MDGIVAFTQIALAAAALLQLRYIAKQHHREGRLRKATELERTLYRAVHAELIEIFRHDVPPALLQFNAWRSFQQERPWLARQIPDDLTRRLEAGISVVDLYNEWRPKLIIEGDKMPHDRLPIASENEFHFGSQNEIRPMVLTSNTPIMRAGDRIVHWREYWRWHFQHEGGRGILSKSSSKSRELLELLVEGYQFRVFYTIMLEVSHGLVALEERLEKELVD
jgi:hypothetical protein